MKDRSVKNMARNPAQEPESAELSESAESVESPPAEEFEPYVEWVGSAGLREVTKEQWEQAGVSDQETVVWTRDQPRVPLASLTEEARRRLSGESDFNFVHEAPKESD